MIAEILQAVCAGAKLGQVIGPRKALSQHRLMLVLGLGMAMGSSLAAEVPGDPSRTTRDKKTTARIEQMPKMWLSSAAFWMDDSHVIFSSSDANGNWQLGDLPKIVILDTVTRKIEPTKYAGYLFCYSAKRMIVDGGNRGGKSVVLEGVYGEPLREIESHVRPTITGIDCESISRDHGVVTIGLKSGDGALRFVSEPSNIASDSFDVEFLSADGKVRASVPASLRTLPSTDRFVYLPWTGGYAKEGAIGAMQHVAGSLVDPKAGTIVPIQGPPLLAEWADNNQGSADVFISRAGPLWRFRAFRGRARLQGLYLQSASGLQRVDDHDVWAPSNISPDGCQFLYGRVAGDRFASEPFKNRDSYDVVLLNVCQGVGQ